MTRNGKIARLPRRVREELNQRLDEGEQGKQLVAWLNGLPEVGAVLERDFQGRPVNEQNLTEWRQGGFLDWQRHQQSLECVRTAREQAQDLAAEAGPVPLTDVLSASVALLLTRLIRELETADEAGPEGRRELLALIREWTALRAGDHKAARLKMQQHDWDRARQMEAEAEAQAAAEAIKAAEVATSPEGRIAAFHKKYEQVDGEVIGEVMKVMTRKGLISTIVAGLPPENAQALRDLIDSRTAARQEAMLAAFKQTFIEEALKDRVTTSDAGPQSPRADTEPETPPDPAESNWIKPNQPLEAAA